MRHRNHPHAVLQRWLTARPPADPRRRAAGGHPAILRDIARIRAIGGRSAARTQDDRRSSA